MSNLPTQFCLNLPEWVQEYCAHYQATTDINQRMAFVISAARQNVERDSGGPFGAAVFAESSGELIALGVNRVTHEKIALAHAEILALTLAQKRLNSFSLKVSADRYQLVTSSEPCAMCLGAICWSGIHSLVCGASRADAEAVGFDEGPVNTHWQQDLEQRGIQVQTQILGNDARQVLLRYQQLQGTIYNA